MRRGPFIVGRLERSLDQPSFAPWRLQLGTAPEPELDPSAVLPLEPDVLDAQPLLLSS